MKVVACQNITPAERPASPMRPADDLPRQADIEHPHSLTPKRRADRRPRRLDEAVGLRSTPARPIAEEAALLAALRDKQIAGAGFDVTTPSRCRSAHRCASSTMSRHAASRYARSRIHIALFRRYGRRTSAAFLTASRCGAHRDMIASPAHHLWRSSSAIRAAE
jgi:hypothetical protein